MTKVKTPKQTATENTYHDLEKVMDARHHDPFSYLGVHKENKQYVLRVFHPRAQTVQVKVGTTWQPLSKMPNRPLFTCELTSAIETPCLLKIKVDQHEYETYDPYTFTSSISDDDLYLFGEGKLKLGYKMLGAHPIQQQGVDGVRFAVWAPNAERVSVVGSFNDWDGRIHSMRSLGGSGVWDIFIPHLTTNDIYKFEIRNRHTGHVLIKTDPYGFEFEERPGNASKISNSQFKWSDHDWLTTRAERDWLHAPFNCYEVHLGSWQRDEKGHFLNYRELAVKLVPHVKEMGYNYVELLPITEHPLNESWGYQTTGYFGVTNRFGSPDDLRFLINTFHQAGIGVILDWVPGHFPKDDWALARFDGTALYEHEDPRLGEHQDWGTYIFNYGRNEVNNFLISNAYFWLNEFHIDGLRVDAVASMLYLDYSRNEGEWIPNKYGGRENLEVIEFFKQLNTMAHEDFPGVLTIAEESTAWPGVSRPVYANGLGFSMKWNMGWMNDTLAYMEEDPVHRKYHHNKLTFGQLYAYTENFVLPFSHDEVVHGKQSMLGKMPGDIWQQFANLRTLMCFQMTSPGKKLNFMGNEFGQLNEWNVNNSLDWHLLSDDNTDHHFHRGTQQLARDLNDLYQSLEALYELDFEPHGFEWLECNDTDQSIISYIRRGINQSFAIIVLNFTPVPREDQRIGVPVSGTYKELINTDAASYGGSNVSNGMHIQSEEIAWMNQPHSISLTVPPLAGIVITLS